VAGVKPNEGGKADMIQLIDNAKTFITKEKHYDWFIW